MIRTEPDTVNSHPPGVSEVLIRSGCAKVSLLRLSQNSVTRILVLILLLSTAALWEAKQISAFSNDEIWCHLRTGMWILQKHAIPHTGLFSQFSISRWIDFSWPYDALCGAVYTLLGLRAFPLLLMMFKVAVGGITFLLAGGRRNFWWAVVLSVLAQFSFSSLQPLPEVFSICLFGLALHCMLEAHRSHDLAYLLWLPPLFLFWANLDARFVLGLLLLFMFLLGEILERVTRLSGNYNSGSPRIPLLYLVAIVAGCGMATMITPYFVHLFPAALQSLYSFTLFKNFSFTAAMSFRRPEHFVLTLLLFSACLRLGREHSRDIFKILLLVCWAALAFRVQRDNWTVVLASIAILGGAVAMDGDKMGALGQISAKNANLCIAAGVATLLTLSFFLLPGNQLLESRLDRILPAKACEYIQENHLPGSLFNGSTWGGYLMWKLPEYPVAMDERLNLYGEEFSDAYFEVIMGKRRMETLPGFASEQIVLLPVNLSMAKALTTIPALQQQFREVYRDKVSIVLVRR